MKIKVRLFDKDLIKSYCIWLSVIGVAATFFSLFVSIPNRLKLLSGIAFFAFLIALYLTLWIRANNTKRIVLTINNSKADVKIGDLHQEKGLKVIAFNEYFDTLVDNDVIASSSLNGKFINDYIDDVAELDMKINESKHLSSRKLEDNLEKTEGKTQKFKLGSIYVHGEYLLTAFTKFDEDNRAFLTMADYVSCLLNFWNEIDIVYANRSVVIPLLGASALTRVRDYNAMSEQEKLELLLWSFKVSRIKFTYPAKVTIVIHESIRDKINFYKLKNI